jgi:hypothetical protein
MSVKTYGTCRYEAIFFSEKGERRGVHRCRLEKGHKLEHICSQCGDTQAANGVWVDSSGQMWDAGTAQYMWKYEGWRG